MDDNLEDEIEALGFDLDEMEWRSMALSYYQHDVDHEPEDGKCIVCYSTLAPRDLSYIVNGWRPSCVARMILGLLGLHDLPIRYATNLDTVSVL